MDKFELAAGCLAISGAQVTCDAIAPVFGGLGYNAVSCVPFREGSCSCSAYLDQSGGLGILSADPASSGKVIVSGDVITLDGQRTYAYCAAGEALTLMPQTVNPTITGTIELVAPL